MRENRQATGEKARSGERPGGEVLAVEQLYRGFKGSIVDVRKHYSPPKKSSGTTTSIERQIGQTNWEVGMNLEMHGE